MTIETVSVIVPAHNEEDYIGYCLEALLEQAEDLHEIIVVDNNSTDSTADIVELFARDNAKVRLVRESKCGVAHARNAGFDSATGTILGRIDADSRVRPSWVRNVKEFFKKNESTAAITGLNNSYDSPFRAMKAAAISAQERLGLVGGGKHIANLHGANMALRATAWADVRSEVSTRRDIHEDFDLALWLTRKGHAIAQLSELWVDISPRRALTPPLEYTTYAAGGIVACREHGFTGRAVWTRIWVAITLYWVSHAMIWLPYRAYDPAARRFSPRYLFTRLEPRISPVIAEAQLSHQRADNLNTRLSSVT